VNSVLVNLVKAVLAAEGGWRNNEKSDCAERPNKTTCDETGSELRGVLRLLAGVRILNTATTVPSEG